MEKWVSKWLEMHSQRQRFQREGGSIHTLPTSLLALSVQAFGFQCPPPPLRKKILWVQPFLHIYFVVFSIWQCVVYDSNFDLHLQLQYSKGNKEDITITYTISRRGSVLRLADSNLSMYIELLKL